MEKSYKIFFLITAIYLLAVCGKNLVKAAEQTNWDGITVMGLCILGLLGFIFWIIKIKNPQ